MGTKDYQYDEVFIYDNYLGFSDFPHTSGRLS